MVLLLNIDKLKTREKYERHFLLLSMIYTEMVRIRRICNLAFENLSEKEKIENFSKPKLLKLVDILRQYKPEHIQTPGHHKKSKIALQQQNAASGNKILSLFYKNQNYTATHFMIFAPVVIMLTRQKILSSLKYYDNMFHRCSRFTPSSACPTFARSLHKLR